MKTYEVVEVSVILFNEGDCIRTSLGYDENELPLIPFVQ